MRTRADFSSLKSESATTLNFSTEKNISDVVSGYTNPHEGWESYQVKKMIRGNWEEWLLELADWKSFLTLTFEFEKYPDVAWSLFKWFVRKNNIHAFGKHYSEKVKHSYFSYVVGMERQSRDVVHFHVLVDRPLDFKFVHRFWGKRCGFVWIDGKIKSRSAALNYLCKYCIKGGQIDVYRAKKDYMPKVVPAWWKEGSNLMSRIEENPPFLADPLQLAQSLTGISQR